MKKMLSILAALGLTATASTAVVACSSKSSSSSSNSQKDGIDWGDSNSVIFTLADGTKVTVGDLISKNSDKLNDYLFNYVNELVANDYTRDYATNILNGTSNLGFMDLNDTYKLQNSDTKVNAYSNEVNNYSMLSSSMDIYRQYISALISPNTLTLDEQYIRHDHLNPSWYKNSAVALNGSYSVWYKNKDGKINRWTTTSEVAHDYSQIGAIKNKSFLPTAEELNGDNFYLVADNKNKDSKGTITPTIGTGWDGDLIKDQQEIQYDTIDALKENLNVVDQNMSGQQALMLRYQSHVQSSSTSSMINALVMEYAKNNLYKMQSQPNDNKGNVLEKATNKSLYVDTSSTVAKDIQSWPSSDTDLVTSNYKMVWTLTVKRDSSKDQAIQDAINRLINIHPTNSKLISTDYSLINKDKDIKSAMATILKAAAGDKAENLSKNGEDPYFSNSGYQGIVKDGKLIDGGTLDIDQTAIEKIKNVEGAGILANKNNTAGITNYAFDNKDNPNTNVDYVFVMPIYLMDLLRDGNTSQAVTTADVSTPDLQNLALNQWLELNPQDASAAWSSSSSFTGTIGGKQIPTAKTGTDELPTETSLLKTNGKTYIFIPTQDAGKDISLTVNGKTITAKSEVSGSDDTSAFGIKGIFETSDKSSDAKKAAWKYNGQTVNYKINLGIDNTNPDSYEKTWTGQTFADQNINDVANLKNSAKEDLMETLFASIAKDDSAIQEETKNAIYRNYISLDDIYYKGLYDKISKYLKEDDKTDASD